MTTVPARIRSEAGQALFFVVFILASLLGISALVVDVGSWYRADRNIQTAADAAALAGAQELPLNQSGAQTIAKQYAQANYAGIPTPDVTFPNSATIHVKAKADTPGIFAPVLNSAFKIVTVHAEAEAQVSAPDKLKNVAPIAIYKDYACIVTNPSCFGQKVVLGFDDDNPYDPTKSKFGLLDLDRDGSAGTGDMKNWLTKGYPDYLSIDTIYPPANGEKNGISNELQDVVKANKTGDNRVLLFPVYDTASSSGYHVIGWAAFVITDIGKWAGKEHILTGHFVTFIATDLAAGNPITDPSKDFGVHVITLTQ
jgi:Putative Flp pilus-assembly TadE/G-like